MEPVIDSPINDHHSPVIIKDEAEFNTNHVFEANGQAVTFQKGPVAECGVNGLHNEHVVAMVIKRLQDFQNSPYACEENQEALEHFEKGLDALLRRTSKRKARGVEGTHAI